MFLQGLIDWTRSFAEKDPKDGLTKIYDMLTGDCIAIVNQAAETSRLPIEVIEVTREDGSKILVQKGVSETDQVFGITSVKYSRLMGEVICSRIAGGAGLKRISEEADMPSYAVLRRWVRDNEEFRKMLEQAQADKAEYFSDEALEVAKEMHDRDYKKMVDVSAANLYTDQLWRKAEADNAKFKPKGKEGNVAVAVQVVIETGIRRQGDPGFNADETERDVTPNKTEIG